MGSIRRAALRLGIGALLLGALGVSANAIATPSAAESPAPTAVVAAGSGSPGLAQALATRSKRLRQRADWLAARAGSPPTDGLQPARAEQARLKGQGLLGTASQRGAARAAADSASITESSWQQIGPSPITSANAAYARLNGGTNSGRVNAIAVATDQRWYIGAAEGGVWKTTDGGLTWTALTDNQPSLATSSIALVPGAPTDGSGDTLYVGTGEANCSGDSYYGAGVLKSTNGGQIWTQTGASIFGAAAIAKIVVDPTDPTRLFASATGCFATKLSKGGVASNVTGFAKSTDSGTTWSLVTDTNNVFQPGMWSSDVAVASDGTVYAVRSQDVVGSKNGVYKSTDHGASFTKLTFAGVPAWTAIYRIALAAAPSNASIVYAALSDQASGELYGVYVTTDAGANWTAITPAAASTDGFGGTASDQWWYDINLAVHPTDPNTVYLLGINVFKTTNGGTSWTDITDVYCTTSCARRVHPDQHGIAILGSSPDTVVVGNDGGVFETTNGGSTWAATNGSGTGALAILQGYRGASAADASVFYSGLQDNGEVKWTPGDLGWREVNGGDGGFTEVDYSNASTVYEEYVYLQMSRSDDGGASWTGFLTSGISQAELDTEDDTPTAQFIAPFVIDPNTPTTLYAGGDRVYISIDKMAHWTQIGSGRLTASNVTLTALGVSKSSSATIYAGDSSGKIYYTHNANLGASATWTASTGLPARWLTDLAVDPTNDQIAYATYGGFTTLGHVFKTINGGATWIAALTLPDAPQQSVAVDQTNPQIVYVGGDLGVYKSTDGGTTWATLNAGLPNASVWHVVLSHDGSTMFAVTHGRSIFMASRVASVATPTTTPTPTMTPTTTPTPTGTPTPTPTQAATPVSGVSPYNAFLPFVPR